MVIKLALCDVNPETCKLLSGLLKTFTMMQQSDTDCNLIYFQSSAELLAAPFDYDVLFIETALERSETGIAVDGIAVGKKLRKMGNRAVFILFTAHSDRYADGYSATVFRYALKPMDQKKFDVLMSELLEFWQTDNKILVINHDKQTDYVRINDIIMIENYRKKRMVHTESRIFYVKESWESLESRLYNDGRFFKPQRGFLINLTHVLTNNKASLTMKNGAVIPFKRGCYTVYCQKLSDYLNRFC